MKSDITTALVKVEQEQQDLNIKISRLGNFIKKEYKTIIDKQRELLKAQYKIMLQYSMILDMRIEDLKKEIE